MASHTCTCVLSQTQNEGLSHVVLTIDAIWDPDVSDSLLTGDYTCYGAVADYALLDISYDVFDRFG